MTSFATFSCSQDDPNLVPMYTVNYDEVRSYKSGLM
jgi:hypothetical protein